MYNTFQPSGEGVKERRLDDFLSFLPIREQDGKATIWDAFLDVLLTSPMNFFLLSAVPAIICYYTNADSGATFVFSLIALAPLSERLGFLTEAVGEHWPSFTRFVAGILLGNLAKLIVASTAIKFGLRQLVLLSVIGSVISHSLLTLGSAFIATGTKKLRFNRQLVHTHGLVFVFLGCAYLAPSVLTAQDEASNLSVVGMSRAMSFLLLFVFCTLVYFESQSHASFFTDVGNSGSQGAFSPRAPNHDVLFTHTDHIVPVLGDLFGSSSANANSTQTSSTATAKSTTDRVPAPLGLVHAFLFLVIFAALTVWLSVTLVGSIEQAAVDLDISATFLAAVLLPVVLNFSEMYSVIVAVRRGYLRKGLLATLGSSLQLTLFVLPIMVLAAWWFASLDVTFNCSGFTMAALFAAVFLTTLGLQQGEAHWLVGAIFIATYFVIAVGYWTHAEESLTTF